MLSTHGGTIVNRTPEVVSTRNDISFSDSLQKKVKIKIVPGKVSGYAVLVFWRAVTDYTLVTRIVHRIGTSRDQIITIQVGVLDVSRTPAPRVS